jgi:mannose-6-phosphate isomerase
LLHEWPARAGECYYLPSGTPHALGAGLVVAEVQTPSDVTYRLYDWNRLGMDGRPRELHVAQAIENMRDDVPAAVIRPVMDATLEPRDSSRAPQAGETPARIMNGAAQDATRLVTCERFVIDHVRALPGCWTTRPMLSVWIMLAGRGAWRDEAGGGTIGPGDVALLPPSSRGFEVTWQTEAEWLEVTRPASAK